jgi:hypothetical protein
VIDVSLLVVSKESDTYSSTYFFTVALVFSSTMHDMLFFKEVYAMLE